MKSSDFKIGDEFTTFIGRWRVTDIGSRVIVAIPVKKGMEDWERGPPYALVEIVFSEDDLPGLERHS